MAYCIKWQFYTSLLIVIKSFIMLIGSAYFFINGHEQAALVFLICGCMLIGCGPVLLLNSFVSYKGSETNQVEEIPKKTVRFSPRIEIYGEGSLSSADENDQGFLEETLSVSSTVNENSVDVSCHTNTERIDNDGTNEEDAPRVEDLEQINETRELHLFENDQLVDEQQSLSNEGVVSIDDALFTKENIMAAKECDLVFTSSKMSDQVVCDKKVGFVYLERINESGKFSKDEIQESVL